MKLSPSKARLGATDANFLGDSISPAGLRPNAEKVYALLKMPIPKDVKLVRALMGGINDYRIFLPDLSKSLRSINSLLRKGVKFCLRPQWKNWYEKSSRSSRFRRFWFSLIGTLSPTAQDRSTCTATIALPGLAPPSTRSSRAVPRNPSRISPELR